MDWMKRGRRHPLEVKESSSIRAYTAWSPPLMLLAMRASNSIKTLFSKQLRLAGSSMKLVSLTCLNPLNIWTQLRLFLMRSSLRIRVWIQNSRRQSWMRITVPTSTSLLLLNQHLWISFKALQWKGHHRRATEPLWLWTKVHSMSIQRQKLTSKEVEMCSRSWTANRLLC